MIFFDHIKGCSKDTTAYDKGLWTWIQFARSSDSTAPYPEIIIAEGSNGINKTGSDGTTKNFLINKGAFSTAYTWPAKPDETVKTLGNIITTLGPAQTIEKDIKIDNAHILNINRLNFTNGKVAFKPTDANNGLQIVNSGDPSLIYFLLDASGITIKSNATFEKTITCSDQITAVSFNATSDKRAKTNIKRLDQEKALDIVNKLPVYSFNYKKDNIPSIGVLAQEAAVYDGAIPNFSLVDNEQATGENGDYQTVKESKLVYILWAAIQEQSHQINQLKSQLKELQK